MKKLQALPNLIYTAMGANGRLPPPVSGPTGSPCLRLNDRSDGGKARPAVSQADAELLSGYLRGFFNWSPSVPHNAIRSRRLFSRR